MSHRNVRGLIAQRRRMQMTNSRHAVPVGPNLLEPKFCATSKPNQVWLADLTYVATEEGWLYMAAIMDLHTRKVLGWATRDHLRAELATSALMMATQRQRPGAGLIQHSDCGVQYACGDYQAAPTKIGSTPSMSHTANPPDNAPVESFFHVLRTELVHHRTYATRNKAKRELFSYVEGFYNRQRLHSAFRALSDLANGLVLPVPSGVLIRDEAGAVIGACGASGDAADGDEAFVIAGIKSVGLKPDPGQPQ